MKYIFVFQQCLILLLLWCAYGSCYFLRKPFGIIKSDIQKSLDLSDDLLGYLDFAFALPYALCSLLFGHVGDSFGYRRTFGCALIGSGIASSVMGKVDQYFELCILLFISGSFQALCWPASCSILYSWFSKKRMSSIMPIYGSCFLVGSICSSYLTITLNYKSNWRNVFAVPSLIVVIIGIVVILCARVNKQKFAENDIKSSPLESESHETKAIPKSSMPLWDILNLPTVFEISLALIFAKGLKTGVMFWLPLYLIRVMEFSVTEAGIIPLTFDVGGLIGSILIIVVLDNIFKFEDIMTCTVTNLLCSFSFLLLLLAYKLGIYYLHFTLFLTGALSSVGEIILCGSIPSKIGEEVNAKASVVGVINGVGSLGNVIEGPIVAWISFYLGAQYLIIVFSIMSFLSFICTLRPCYMQRQKIVLLEERKDTESI